jgi:putative ABC transport system permease protein
MSSRFDLKKAIAAWRRSLEYNSALLREDVDELESHVRDQVRGLVLRGLTEEEAFERAIRQMGNYGKVESEYQKVYWGKVRRRHELTHELTWRAAMFKNYLKTAFRNLLRHKGYSAINITGLTIGLTCCMLIFQFVAFQKSFDTFHENADRIYRVAISENRSDEGAQTSAIVGFGAVPALTQEVPEIVRYVRIRPDFFQEGPTISYNGAGEERVFKESRVLFADSSVLNMFTYPLVKGDPATALRQPQTLLLTESTARRYFGTEDPVGKVLEYTSAFLSGTFTVAGVLKDVPANSHLQFDVLLFVQDLLNQPWVGPDAAWDANDSFLAMTAYVEIGPSASIERIEQKLTDVLHQHTGDDIRASNAVASVELQPLRSVYLDQDTAVSRIVTGDPKTVYFFSTIALVTLAIALVNYVNLATARAVGRAKEVGVRKVVGAQRGQLIGQFLLESVLTNLAALVLAFTFAALLTPVMNRLAGTQLSAAMWGSGPFLAAFLGVFAVGVVLAGLYPAFVLSSFKPVRALNGTADTFAARVSLRKGLVVLQFAASVVLLIGTGVVYSQLDFMRRMDVGLDLEQILIVTSPRVLPEGMDSRAAERTFRDEVRKMPVVMGASFSGNVAGQGFIQSVPARLDGADPSTARGMQVIAIDHNFAEVYGIELVAGMPFREDMPSWRTGPSSMPRPVLINETAVRELGLPNAEAAIDQVIDTEDQWQYVVHGVLKDFNWSSAHQPADAVLFRHNPTNRFLSLKVNTADLPGTVAAMRETFEAMFPGNVFEYTFADAAFAEQYRNDERFATIFGVFAGLAILIACLGLFGLASFTAARRTKEIGVRKVLGASVSSIVTLLSRDFMLLVGVALLVAAPIAYYFMNQWLQDFAYHITLGPGLFLLAGGLALLIALLTVSYQAIKAALADPVKSLRYE